MLPVRGSWFSGARAAGFSAGRDLADAEPLTEDAAVILRETFNPLFEAIRSLRIPTISAVRGPALGVGLGLALACDMTIVSDDARLGSPFANIGAVLDSGGHFHLVNRVGAHRALELIYTARLLSGTEAASIGLVNRSVPAAELDDVTTTLSEALANGPTNAFSLSKRLVQRIEDELLTFRDVLDLEAGAQAAAAATTDYAEGIGAFQEKRKPTFNGA